MQKIGPTRCYLKHDDETFSRFLRFHNYRPNEMMIGLHGLASKQSKLDLILSDRTVSADELNAVQGKWSDAIEVKEPVDHITCHVDGKFHIKTKNDKDLYVHELKREEPLNPDTPTFLDFIIVSDLGKKYSSRTKSVKSPAIYFGVKPMELVTIRGMFSGANYDLKEAFSDPILTFYKQKYAELRKQFSGLPNDLAAFLSEGLLRVIEHTGDFKLIELSGDTLKGMLLVEKKSLQEEIPNKPSGTFISFNFPTGENSYLIKTFVFS